MEKIADGLAALHTISVWIKARGTGTASNVVEQAASVCVYFS
jgi:hypothetical protein